MSSGGKSGSGGSGSKTYNYYGSIAARVRCGRTDVLRLIILDGKVAWSGPLYRTSSPNPAVITIPGRGVVRYYWGLPDQFTVDPILQASGNDQGHDHSAYTGQSYIVLEDFFFGQEQNFANRIKVEASAIPEQTLITGTAAALDSDGQANPYACIAELATSERFGQGLPASTFAASTWQSSANAALAQSALTYVSPALTEQSTLKQFSQDVLVLCDGWLRAQKETGACEAGFFPQPETIDPSTLPLIDSSAIALGDNPSWDSQTWRDVKTSWVVNYTDKDKDYKTRSSQRYDDPRAAAARDLRDIETLDRPYICRADQAFQHAQKYGRRFAVPGSTGTIPVRRVVAQNLKPGQHLRLDIDPEPGGFQLQQVSRLISVSRPRTGSVTLNVEIEPTLQPIAFTPAPPPSGPLPPAEVPDVAFVRFFEVPLGLAAKNFDVGILVSRPSGLVVDFAAYYDQNPAGYFPRVGAARAYGLRGRLNASIASGDTGPFSIELLDTFNRELIGEDPGDAAARDDTLLMIVLKIGGGGQIDADSDNKAWIEIFSCETFVASGTNIRTVTALRSRQGTPARDFALHDEVWFLRRDALTIIEHADFATLGPAAGTAYFKLQPGTQAEQRPLEDCSLRTFSFALARDTPVDTDGTYLETRYKRSNLIPSTPTGDTPAGWFLYTPSGSGAVWGSSANRSTTTGHVVGSWSTPVRLSGSVFLYQDSAPDNSELELKPDDVWFDTNDQNKIYTWDGSGWVARFTPILKLDSGNRVYGLQTAGGGDVDWVMLAEHFQIWNGSTVDVPFEVIGDRTYIANAFIRELAAGKITAGAIDVALRLNAAYLAAGKMATGAARCNDEDENKTMPFISYGSTDLASGGAIDGSTLDESVGVDVYTDSNLSFVGWQSGADGYNVQRFGTNPAPFQFSLTGNGSVTAGRIGVEMMYRVNGGGWVSCSAHNVVQTLYGNISITNLIKISVSGTDTIDFGVSLNKDSGTSGSVGELKVGISCFNG